MQRPKLLLTAFLLSLGGTAFAGWLSYQELTTGAHNFMQCATNLAALPACVYGTLLFASLSIVTGFAYFRSGRSSAASFTPTHA